MVLYEKGILDNRRRKVLPTGNDNVFFVALNLEKVKTDLDLILDIL